MSASLKENISGKIFKCNWMSRHSQYLIQFSFVLVKQNILISCLAQLLFYTDNYENNLSYYTVEIA